MCPPAAKAYRLAVYVDGHADFYQPEPSLGPLEFGRHRVHPIRVLLPQLIGRVPAYPPGVTNRKEVTKSTRDSTRRSAT
jgi:hypothetical protein